MADERLERMVEAAGAALAGEPVRFAYVFGSQVTGRTHPASDVDVAVMPQPALTEGRLEFRLRLAALLERATGVGPVEVVLLDEVPLPVLGRILAARRVLCSVDEPGRVAFESRSMRQYLDFRLSADRWDRVRLRAVAQAALMVDPGRLRSLVDRMGAEAAGLRRLARHSDADFSADPDLLAAVKYRCLVAIEAAIDAAQHMAASEGLRAPVSGGRVTSRLPAG